MLFNNKIGFEIKIIISPGKSRRRAVSQTDTNVFLKHVLYALTRTNEIRSAYVVGEYIFHDSHITIRTPYRLGRIIKEKYTEGKKSSWPNE